MSRLTRTLSGTLGAGISWLARYLGWLFLTATFTLGGATLLMLFKDWTLKSLFVSMLSWPILGLAALVALPIAFLPLGRVYLSSALLGAFLWNLVLLMA
ncbi:MAG TPA: hypothetical protein VLM84_10350 [Chromatiaceae bacterium]|jgi:hypothetical protein|nr:hypothetical protein [Chromatiaceae bacterium]